ncbi:MFS transporter [Trichocoleus sp. FACHB-591]|uniref:MFS transporter n=1 Tax=Trichocoleus sp. FACHB-591 TaxID=2692872 RepID=UPI001F55347E|nr:MFS transporter [Trichocoleus sp. FACHB-591]
MEPNQPTSLRKFLILWSGQVASVLGTEMTNFAITLWAWELTGQATPLALIFFFTRTPKVIAASFAGVLVDRWNRKQLMMIGDGMAGISTVVLLSLLLTDQLAIWHLYVAGAVNGLFGYFQDLAYSTSMSQIVPKQHYARATAMDSYLTYSGSAILAPAIAGILYPLIKLPGILLIDLVTFLIAVGTVWFTTIPQPKVEAKPFSREQLWEEFTFGFRYIFRHPSLLAILLFLLNSNLLTNAAWAIQPVMILARSQDNATALASVQAAIGIGGVVGGVLLSVWGGPKRRIHGLLLGQTFGELSSVFLGLSKSLPLWMGTGFLAAIFSPFIGSSNQAIWLSKVDPAVQGKVFASRYLIAQLAAPLGLAIAGPLADKVFEPAMQPGGFLTPLFSGIFGTGNGAGMALQFTLFSILGVLVGVGGYAFRTLRDVETLVPDYDIKTSSPTPSLVGKER